MLAFVALCIVGVTGEAWEAWAGRVLPGVITRAQDASRYSGNSFFVWFTYVSPYCHLFSFVGGVLTAQLYFQLKAAGVRRATNELMFWAGTAWVLVACSVFSDANAGTLGPFFFLRNNFLLALAYAGFMLNLFNLLPLSLLDGGRVTAVISPRLWLLGGGTTAGIALMTIALWPSLRRSGWRL